MGEEAARVNDGIEHSHALGGFLAGALAGLAVGVAVVAFTVATGGAGLAVVAAVGTAMATTGGTAMLGGALGKTSTFPAGPIAAPCSSNVFYNNRAAARAELDGANCTEHPGQPKLIATGAATVFVNQRNAARKGEKTVCDGTISSGSDNVLIGGESVQLLEITPEIPPWMTTTATVLVIAGTVIALGAGGAAAFAGGGTCALINFAGRTIGEFALGYLGGELGGAIGGQLFGERGEIIGNFLGSMAAGFGGNKLGNRASAGHPVDVASGALFAQETDFALNGPMLLAMRRVWMSSSRETGRTGSMGSKWHHPFDMRLVRWEDGGGVVVRLEEGRLAAFTHPLPGRPSLNTAEGMTLEVVRTPWGNGYRMQAYDGHYALFGPAPGQPDLWLLAETGDANGNRVRLERDDHGLLLRLTDSTGRVLRFTSNKRGWITAIHGPAPDGSGAEQRLVSYAYSDQGDMIAVTDGRGNVTRYDYAAHLMVRESHPGGLRYHFQWDDPLLGHKARCIRTWGESAEAKVTGLHLAELTYDDVARTTSVLDGFGGVTVYHRDSRDNILRKVEPNGFVTTYAYDYGARLLSRDGVRSEKFTATYDRFGRMLSKDEAQRGATRYEYASDDLASPLFAARSVIDSASDGLHRFVHDARGNVEIHIDPLGQEVRTLRDTRGRPVAEIDALGTRWRWQWDGQGLLSGEGPDELTRHYGHDALGRLNAVSGKDYDPLRIVHDENDNILRLEYRHGGTIAMEYDPDNRLILRRGQDGAVTRWNYAGLRRPIARANANGTMLRYSYGPEMHLTGIINEKGESYTITYGVTGHPERETRFDGSWTAFGRAPDGMLVALDDMGEVTRYDLDRQGRMVEKHLPDGSQHRFAYTEGGRMSLGETPDSRMELSFDALGRVDAIQQDGQTIRYGYDARGRVIECLIGSDRLGWTRNPAGAVMDAHLNDQQVASWRFSEDGRTIRRQQGVTRRDIRLDDRGNIAADTLTMDAQVPGAGGGTGRDLAGRDLPGREKVLVSRRYDWSDAGALTRVQDNLRGTRSYHYDPVAQLTAVEGEAAEERFAYDPAGNLLGSYDPAETAPPPLHAVRGNRLEIMGDTQYAFDARGRVVRMQSGQGGHRVTELEWGGNNLMVAARVTDRSGTKEIRFGYDVFNRRTRKVTRHVSGWDGAEQVLDDTAYLWDASDILVAEGPAESDPLARLYLWDEAPFQPLAVADRPTPAAARAVFHYNTDHLGTPQEVVDADGRIVWQARYRAFGAALETAEDGFHQPLRFKGQYFDAETGLHYNRHRYYDPRAGRYLQPDPIAEFGGTNLYSYGPNPVVYTDALGLAPNLPPTNGPPPGDGNWSLYHIIDNKTGEVVYVGITQDVQARTNQHTQQIIQNPDGTTSLGPGRLDPGQQDYSFQVEEGGMSEWRARGMEQAHIEYYGTRNTANIGADPTPGMGNKVNSFLETRTDPRGTAFGYWLDKERQSLGGCKG
ncbi:RHS repeat-associated core domain-containing protein [Paracoccus pacificus]|uniref:RHS repeat-associated core domain-containing protein n=1 Tax=Paracoccus pacificus TaxID=1463598 RepID=A0ABW4R523_9RHOB